MKDDEDIFDLFDKLFGGFNRGYNRYKDNDFIEENMYERLMDDDNIYYTFQLPTLHKEDIVVETTEASIDIKLNKFSDMDEYSIPTAYPILPNQTKVTFRNGILDITTVIDKEKTKRIEIE